MSLDGARAEMEPLRYVVLSQPRDVEPLLRESRPTTVPPAEVTGVLRPPAVVSRRKWYIAPPRESGFRLRSRLRFSSFVEVTP